MHRRPSIFPAVLVCFIFSACGIHANSKNATGPSTLDASDAKNGEASNHAHSAGGSPPSMSAPSPGATSADGTPNTPPPGKQTRSTPAATLTGLKGVYLLGAISSATSPLNCLQVASDATKAIPVSTQATTIYGGTAATRYVWCNPLTQAEEPQLSLDNLYTGSSFQTLPVTEFSWFAVVAVDGSAAESVHIEFMGDVTSAKSSQSISPLLSVVRYDAAGNMVDSAGGYYGGLSQSAEPGTAVEMAGLLKLGKLTMVKTVAGVSFRLDLSSGGSIEIPLLSVPTSH